jgi:hypothetical protein
MEEMLVNSYYERGNLDTTVKILKMAFQLENWDQVNELADQLFFKAMGIYRLWQDARAGKTLTKNLHTERPLVYYIGFSHLMNGIGMQKKLRFKESREYVMQYKDLRWVSGLNKAGLAEVEYYESAATTNLYVLDLLEGKTETLPNYMNYLLDNPDEVMPCMITLLEANRLTGIPIEEYLQVFKSNIQKFDKSEDSIKISYYLALMFEFALYYNREGRVHEAIDALLQCFSICSRTGNEMYLRKYVALFENLRDQATAQQIASYKTIFEGALL